MELQSLRERFEAWLREHPTPPATFESVARERFAESASSTSGKREYAWLEELECSRAQVSI